MTSNNQMMCMGVPCEVKIDVYNQILTFENGIGYIHPAGFPGQRARLLGFVVEQNRTDRVTDLFFEYKPTVDIVKGYVNYTVTEEKKPVTTVQFHPYMNEMTVTQIRELAPRLGTKEARVEVEDKSGRKAIVPRAWLKKTESVPPKDEYQWALCAVYKTVGTGLYSYEAEASARRMLAATGNKDRYVLVKKLKGEDDGAYRLAE
jgi:hypothetical protein